MRQQILLGAVLGLCVTASINISAEPAVQKVGTAKAEIKPKKPLRLGVESKCDIDGSTLQIVKYFAGPPTQHNDPKCDGDHCSLSGWLYIPNGVSAGSPAVVYLHGHDQLRGEPCKIVEYFLKQKWVAFAPVRRGNSGKAPDGSVAFTNTGKYIDTWAQEQPGGDVKAKYEEYRVKYLRDYQVHDVDHALEFLSNYPSGAGKLVDAKQIGVIGHSYGGALSIFSATGAFAVNPVAIADISGAELSWNNTESAWKSLLEPAVSARKVPIYFLQPSNGLSISPTINLMDIAAGSGNKQFEAAVFPPVEGTTDAHEVHERFIGQAQYVAKWGPSVKAFFERYFP